VFWDGHVIAAVDTCGAVSGGRVIRLQTYDDVCAAHSLFLLESCCYF
jgi:hypothetical protein